MGNGLQGGGALIGKPHAHKESSLLQAGKKREARGDILLLQNSWPGWGLGVGLPYTTSGGDWTGPGGGATPYRKWQRLGGAWGWGYPIPQVAETGRGLGVGLPHTTSGRDWVGPGGGATPIPQVAEIGWGLGVGLRYTTSGGDWAGPGGGFTLYHKWRRLGGAWGWGKV